MSLIDDIRNCFNYNEIPNEPNFRAVLFGENAMYLENIKTLPHDIIPLFFKSKLNSDKLPNNIPNKI